MTQDDNLNEIILEKLTEFGFPYASASLFCDLNSDKKTELENTLQHYGIKNPIAFYSQQFEKDWVIIGTNELVINSGNKIQIIDFDKITSIKSDRNERLNKFKLDKYTLNSNLAFELTNWVIKDKNNSEYLISIDKGVVWGSFYHLMQKILREKGFW